MSIRKGILRNSLMMLYADDLDIINALSKIDFSAIDRQFEKEVLSRISEQHFKQVDDFLRSDLYADYKIAVEQASMTLTQELGTLIQFVTTPNMKGLN